MNSKKNTDSIIARFLAGSANDEESEFLLQWLKQSRENRKTWFSTKRIWLKSLESDENDEFISNSWNRLKIRTLLQKEVKDKGEKSIKASFRKLSIAASILVLIGISSFLGIKLKNLSDYQHTFHEITAPMGSRTSIMLSDGTRVWLNAGSKLTYRSDFGLRDRDVSLSGEAYFDVQQHENSVFSVNTRDLNIRVLGTKFNIKSYPDEEITETTIVSGKVEVNVTEKGIAARPVLLTQNQKITYSRAEGIVQMHRIDEVEEEDIKDEDIMVEKVGELVRKPSIQIAQVINTDKYTSWKDGKLVFRSEELGKLAPKLERFYNIDISFENESIKDMKYSGVLENVTVEEVLRAIATASKINYKIDKNRVFFSN